MMLIRDGAFPIYCAGRRSDHQNIVNNRANLHARQHFPDQTIFGMTGHIQIGSNS